MKKPLSLAILGSTGSLGQQTLDVVRQHPDRFQVFALAANKNIDALLPQIKEFKPKIVAVYDRKAAARLKKMLEDYKPIILAGANGLRTVATHPETQKVVFVSSGLTALSALMEAIKSHKKIAIATKELIVAEGEKIMKLARKNRVTLIPIDSEHSAIFQCLQGEDPASVEKIILTCSGGPLYGKTEAELADVTPEQALEHPTWKMGAKISIDSATLMNKGFEMIEAKHLFGLKEEQIEIVIHPESIIHSLVIFKDGNIKAQLASPDMRIPITYALSYPERIKTTLPRIDFQTLSKLTFIKPDFSLFKGPLLAYEASRKGGKHPKKLIQKNEEAVQKFLKKEVSFLSIFD